MNLNSVLIAGRLVRDPEFKSLPSGAGVATFSVATSKTYKKGDKTVEEVEYHNIVVYGKQAENCSRYLKKGQVAMVSGELRTRSWDKDGAKQYRTEIIASRVQFGPQAEGSEEKPERTSKRSGSYPKEQPAPSTRPEYYPEDEIDPDDIPF